jgi:NAD dependent epimerase/dehydratase family enzyme
MWLPFMLGLGGPLGSGQQQTSWVHVDDWARLAHWAMDRHVNTAALAASAATYVAAASYAAPPVADPLAPVGKAPGESEHSKAAAATPAPSAASKNPNASFPSPVAKQYPVTTYNVTAPSPVTNKVFARALGRALHRPAILPLPAFVLKLILGDFAEYALGGQRVVPAAALKDGFQFNHPDIGEALQDVVAKRKK